MPFTKVKLREFNPTSRQQVGNRLITAVRLGARTSSPPRASRRSTKRSWRSCPYDMAPLLTEFFTVEKRIGQLAEGDQAWLRLVRRGPHPRLRQHDRGGHRTLHPQRPERGPGARLAAPPTGTSAAPAVHPHAGMGAGRLRRLGPGAAVPRRTSSTATTAAPSSRPCWRATSTGPTWWPSDWPSAGTRQDPYHSGRSATSAEDVHLRLPLGLR